MRGGKIIFHAKSLRRTPRQDSAGGAFLRLKLDRSKIKHTAR